MTPPLSSKDGHQLSKPEAYIADVLSGKQIVSKWVRQAIERHVRDLAEGPYRAKPIKFRPELGHRIIQFVEDFILGTEGIYDGRPWILEPWTATLIFILYGWAWKDTGLRRFRFAYSEISRGNLKSTLASALCVYELISVKGAAVYCAATDSKAARVVYDTASLMVSKSKHLSSRIDVLKNNLSIPKSGSKCEPCSADKKSVFSASRPSFVVLDELHMHPNADVWRTFVTALGKRPEAMLFAITNSGWDRNSVCWKQREYSTRVLDGLVLDDSWFAWICGLDVEDDWQDENNWIKANPSLGHAVSLDFLRQCALRGKESPSELNEFLRFNWSVWTVSHSIWMPLDKWDECNDKVDPEALKGLQCFAGMDLSTSNDISAVALLFPPQAGFEKWQIIPHFWLPRENIPLRVRRDKVPYDLWQRQGLFHVTEGNIIDTQYIRVAINEFAEKYQLVEICYDPYRAVQLVTELQSDGLTVVPVRQGDVSMTGPLERLMTLVLRGEIAHSGNPILRWMVGNTVVVSGATGLMKPDKSRSTEKIDGVTATLNALFRAMVVPLDGGVITYRGVRSV